jgi:CHRD domain
MRGLRPLVLLLPALMLAMALSFGTALADNGGRPFNLALSGANEFDAAGQPINPHGDADRGSAKLTINPGQEEVCWSFGAITLTAGEALPFAAHIHIAPEGIAGPIVVDIFGGAAAAPAPTSYPTGTTCVHGDRDVLTAILQDPGAYYLNLHNAQHPGGVMRAQLG